MSWYAKDVTKFEVRFDGTNWVDVSAYLDLAQSISIDRGREDETGDPINPGTLSLTLINDDGRFSPEMSGSPYYPYVVEGVAVRLSMLTNGTWRQRFWGTVTKWSASIDSPLGSTSSCSVSAVGRLGSFPSYTLMGAALEAVRGLSNMVACWPLRDSGSPAEAAFGTILLKDNGGDGWGLGPLLPMDEGTDPHPSFVGASGKLQLSNTSLNIPQPWTVWITVPSAPSDGTTLLRLNKPSSPYFAGAGATDLTWTTADGFGLGNGLASTVLGPSSSWPQLVAISQSSSFTLIDRWSADGSHMSSSIFLIGNLKSIVVNPVLTGSKVFSAGYLTITAGLTSEGAALAAALLSTRSVSLAGGPIEWLATRAGVTSLTGTPTDSVLPNLDGRTAADALSATLVGTGDRIVEADDGALNLIAFPPQGSVVALPAEKVNPGLLWETSSVGRYGSCTVTRYDGRTYTSGDGLPSTSIEGVHTTWSLDQSYADWVVNSPVKARMSDPSFGMDTMSAADQDTISALLVGSRASLGSLPSALMPSSQIHIVEGISDTISKSGWTVTLHLSPDVYSRILVWDSGDTWDGGKLWGP